MSFIFCDTYSEWLAKCKEVPMIVTRALKLVGNKYKYNVHEMNDHYTDVLNELKRLGYQEVWQYICPEGELDEYIWHYSLSAMHIRLYYEQKGKGQKNCAAENKLVVV